MDVLEKEAILWLSNEIKNIPNIIFQKDIKKDVIIEDDKNIKTKKNINAPLTENVDDAPPICELILFKYNATVGNVNGYWDKFPIVLIVRPFPDHFFGFNLHYLDEKVRTQIINTLIRLSKKNISKEKMLMSIYPFLSGLVKIGLYNYAYKNYSNKNLESKMVVIKREYYHLVAKLPIARFKGNKQ